MRSEPKSGESCDSLFTAPPAERTTSGRVVRERLTLGALRGAIAAMAMTGAREFTRHAGLLEEPPPESIFGRRLLRRRLRGAKRGPVRAQAELAHWSYGAAAGALFAALPAALRQTAWSGPLYGLLVWTSFELGIAPLLDLPQARRVRVRDRLALAGDHLLYGFMLSDDTTLHSSPRRPPVS
jgi:hypothetical protein